MSFVPTERQLHAGICVSISIIAIGLSLAVAIETLSSILKRMNSLAEASTQRAAFSSRLDERRIETRENLKLIGAAPNDLRTLTDPAKAKLIVLSACEEIAGEFDGACEIEEAPISEALSRHRARLTAVGEFTALTASLSKAIVPPIRVASVSIRADDLSDRTKFSVVFELIGAGAAGEPP